MMSMSLLEAQQCYKEEIAQAQTYFALKTHEAELQPASMEPTYTASDALRDRVLPNMKNVPHGFFTTAGELFKHLYNLEKLLNQTLDNQSQIEVSVGKLWSAHARNVLHIPEDARCTYRHVCPNGHVARPWAYSMLYATDFDVWFWEVYVPKHFEAYVQYRARYIGASPKRIGAKTARVHLLPVHARVEQLPLFPVV